MLVFSGWGEEASKLSFLSCLLWLVSREPFVLKLSFAASWLHVWPCLIFMSQFPYASCPGVLIAFYDPVTVPLEGMRLS